MRRYDEPVEVRKGLVAGGEAPEQFVWRGRLWVVRVVLAYWVETGAWWTRAATHTAALSAESGHPDHLDHPETGVDLLAEQEVWRVEAGRGRQARAGVFDLAFDWGGGAWRLVGVLD